MIEDNLFTMASVMLSEGFLIPKEEHMDTRECIRHSKLYDSVHEHRQYIAKKKGEREMAGGEVVRGEGFNGDTYREASILLHWPLSLPLLQHSQSQGV